MRKLIIVDCPSSFGLISNRSSHNFPHSFSPGFQIAMPAHKKTHEAKPLFKCQFCDKDLPSQYLLCNHTKKYHRPELGVCGNCGKECGSKANMREHKKHCKKAMKRAEKMGEGEEGGRNEFDPLEMRQQI